MVIATAAEGHSKTEIRQGSLMELFLRSPALTLMDLFLREYVTNNVHVQPLSMTLHELKTRIREACAKIGHQIPCNMWQKSNIGLMLLEPAMALKLHFIITNDCS